MAALSPSAILFRDSLRYVFPTVIGVSMFAPFTRAGRTVSAETVVFGSILLGFVLAPLVISLSSTVFEKLPRFGKHVRSSRETRAWVAGHWDYDELFYSRMDKDEREYIYITASYVDFHQQVSFFLGVYFLLNLTVAIRQAISRFDAGLPLLPTLSMPVPMLGGWGLPVWLILPAALFLAVNHWRYFLAEYEDLFGEAGKYDLFAVKYQKKDGGLARSIWGKVERCQRPVCGINVTLKTAPVTHMATTDAAGRFQFKGVYGAVAGIPITITAGGNGWVLEEVVLPTEKLVPRFDLRSD